MQERSQLCADVSTVSTHDLVRGLNLLEGDVFFSLVRWGSGGRSYSDTLRALVVVVTAIELALALLLAAAIAEEEERLL